jgi:hypothetical protein
MLFDNQITPVMDYVIFWLTVATILCMLHVKKKSIVLNESAMLTNGRYAISHINASSSIK